MTEAGALGRKVHGDSTFALRPTADKYIDEGVNRVYVKGLRERPDQLERAWCALGWNQETIEKFGVGFHPSLARYTIPIRSDDGRIWNIRLYQPGGQLKWTSYSRGYGAARLFPLQLLRDATHVLLVEGEKDALLANQALRNGGYRDWVAVTSTGGAGTWKSEWNGHFAGKTVAIAYDCDPAGEPGARRVATELVHHAAELKVINLDIPGEGADITDYFLRHSKECSDLMALIEQTVPFHLAPIFPAIEPEQVTARGRRRLLGIVMALERSDRRAGGSVLEWAARHAGKLHTEGAVGEDVAKRVLLEAAEAKGLSAALGDDAVNALVLSGWSKGVRS